MAAKSTDPEGMSLRSGATPDPVPGPPPAEAVAVQAAAVQVLDAVEQSRQLAWQVAVDAAGVGTFDWDLTSGKLLCDERFAVLFGYGPADGLQPDTQGFPRRVHPDDLPEVNAAIAAAISACGEYAAEYRIVHPDTGVRWVACRARALADASGRAVRMLGAAYDTTIARTGHEQANRAAWRAELLGRVTVELTETLDADQAVARLVGVLVPALADWCIVSLIPDDQSPGPAGQPSSRYQLRDVGWAHVDPDAGPVLQQYLQARTSALTEDNPVARALRTGRPTHVPADATSVLQASLAPGPARDLIGDLAPETALIVPLRARGRTVGLISLYNRPDRGPLTAADVDVVREVAGRAGLALDNTRLYRQQRRLAEELQRSMLTDPPAVEHLQFAVRYVPAGEATQVGGDWYDAFTHPDGTVTVAIGDVVGHDVAAAGAMGQLRSMLRTIAAYTGAGPADVLHGLDTTMHTLAISFTATAVIAQIHQPPTDRAQGTARLQWSSAGHPPPVILHPDGKVTELTTPEPDLLLGLDPALARTQTTQTLETGDTLVLYTDGLIERRDQPLDDGLDLLHHALTNLPSPGMPLDHLCDHLLAQILPAHPQDDVALTWAIHEGAGLETEGGPDLE